jgi:hypothetical protein
MGLLAIHAELAGARLVLNEIADTRAGLLDRLFPGAGVTRYDAANIHNHLDAAVRPSVVLMNPPISAAPDVDGRVADAALRHMSSALTRLADGGRLVVITGANLSPDNPSWRDGFVRLQERGRVVFSAAVDGRVYARHGTTVETRLHVIDRIPADDPAVFPASAGTAGDTATLLGWVTRDVPSRVAPKVSATAHVAPPVTKRTPSSPARPYQRPQRSAAAKTIEPASVELGYETIDWKPSETGRITDVLYEGYRRELPTRKVRNGMIAPRRQPPLCHQIAKEGTRSDGDASGAATPMWACPIEHEAADRCCRVGSRIISQHRQQIGQGRLIGVERRVGHAALFAHPVPEGGQNRPDFLWPR